MKRSMLALLLTLTAVGATAATASSGRGTASLCVGSEPGCFSTIQAAINAAGDRTTIRIGSGTFAGGIMIDRSLQITGAGPNSTTIRGGGPVVTIGTFLAPTEPTVSISGVTIAGGVTTTSPESNAWVGKDNVIALAGGISIPPADGYSTGATVLVTNSVIRGNRSAPTDTVPFGPPCPDGPCPYAGASGGGIDSWGTLTLVNTTVNGNEAGGAVASDAEGGGILCEFGSTLTLKNSAVQDNVARAVEPNGRYGEGGGIFVRYGVPLTVSNSSVSGNTASLTSSLPSSVELVANGGGIHAGDGSAVSIDNTRIDNNTVSVDDPTGEPAGFDAGILVAGSSLALTGGSVSNNHVTANAGSTADVGPSGGALEFDGPATVSNTRITGNTSTVTSEDGVAGAVGAISAFAQDAPAVISNTLISGNRTSAVSTTGSATVQGGALLNNGRLELRNDQITDNTGTASGTAGFAEGGGIWNGVLLNPPPVELMLRNTNVTGNTLMASAGIEIHGGGIFTSFPVTLDTSRIARNVPDQCFGC